MILWVGKYQIMGVASICKATLKPMKYFRLLFFNADNTDLKIQEVGKSSGLGLGFFWQVFPGV